MALAFKRGRTDEDPGDSTLGENWGVFIVGSGELVCKCFSTEKLGCCQTATALAEAMNLAIAIAWEKPKED